VERLPERVCYNLQGAVEARQSSPFVARGLADVPSAAIICSALGFSFSTSAGDFELGLRPVRARGLGHSRCGSDP